jgi:hypothetical protein
MDYVPVTTRVDNQLYRFAGMLAHNLTREFMQQSGGNGRGSMMQKVFYANLWIKLRGRFDSQFAITLM